MTSYDTLTVSSHQAPIDKLRLAPPEVNETPSAFPHDLDFHTEAMFTNVHPLPFTPSYDLDAFSTTFDDPLGYQSNIFETLLEDTPNNPESISLDIDNCKLLGFGTAIHKTPVFDQAEQTWPRMSAELNGMFCVAEDVFEGDASGRPLELTCYRRNLFQISGTIILSRTVGHVLLDQCRQAAIYGLVASLTATESIEGKPTDIITVPWKSGVNGAHIEERIGASPAADIPIDLTPNQETDPMFVSVPVAWGRLQFKYATANNGRRKGLQQHYRIQISLMAKVEGEGQLIKLAEIQSNPIVVRGRSPKNFDSSKDVPLNERKAESVNRVKNSSIATIPQWIEPSLSQSQKYHSVKAAHSLLDTPNWTVQSPTTNPEYRSKKSATLSNQRRRPPVQQTQWIAGGQDNNLPPSKPSVDLSLAEDDSPRHTSTNFGSSKKQSSKSSVASPLESADHLYEYFPLSLDDWMPPVDAIYRPHVVHHLRVVPDLKAQQVRAKPKRYFSAED